MCSYWRQQKTKNLINSARYVRHSTGSLLSKQYEIPWRFPDSSRHSSTPLHEWSSRQRCWSGSVFAVSLQSTSGTSAFPLHLSKAASVCDLPLLELYWFHALRQGSGVSPSMDLPSGTVCHQHYVRQICRRTPSSGHWRRISSHPSSDTWVVFETLPLLINLPTYLLTYLLGMLRVTPIMPVLLLLSVVGVGMQQYMIRNHILNI